MSNSPMGSWRKPPLAYVVAEIRLSPFYKLGQYVPEFQAEVRTEFPRAREGNVVRFELQGSAPTQEIEKVWQFFSENQCMGIALSTRTLSLHVTEYRNFEDFSESLRAIVTAAGQTIPDLFVEQLGLRYIDYVLPSAGEKTFDYFVDSVRGFVPPGASDPREAYWIADFPFEKGSVNVRLLPVMPAGVSQPPNFGPLELTPSQNQQEAITRVQNKQPIGCIDTDRIMPVGKKFDSREIIDLFSKMHDDVSQTFKAIISDKAKSVWV
jgi:uncharacterized protein (TIGR04255 family)